MSVKHRASSDGAAEAWSTFSVAAFRFTTANLKGATSAFAP